MCDVYVRLCTITFQNNGRIPLHQAAYHGHTEMAKLLVEKGADVNTANVSRLTHTPYIQYVCLAVIDSQSSFP